MHDRLVWPIRGPQVDARPVLEKRGVRSCYDPSHRHITGASSKACLAYRQSGAWPTVGSIRRRSAGGDAGGR